MNWGYTSSKLNNGWYSLTGDWYVTTGSDYNYNIKREMLYISSINLTN